MDSSARLQIATLIAVVFVVLVGIGNIMAVDRLEKQVIRVAQDVEKIKASGGGGSGAVARPAASSGSMGDPGSGTGFTAIGWGGKSAEITVVEGHTGQAYRLQDKPKPQGDHYVNRRNEPPGSLNQYATNEGDARTVSQRVLDKLMEPKFDDPTDVMPALATSWEVSDDGLVYTYNLRKGVQFADGRPFTSADVKFSFDVMRDPGVNAEHLRGGFEDVVKLEAPDKYTVKVTYRQKYWKGLYKVGTELPVLNKGWFEENIPLWAAKLGVDTFATEPGKPGFGEVFNKIRIVAPGTGPYYFEGDDYEPESGVRLVQNPFYWGIQVHPTWFNFAKLRWVYISDQVTAFEEFRKEKFDVTVVDFNAWDDEYSKDPTITEISDYYEYDHTGLAYSFISWNTREPPLDDPKVRYALAHLVDRQWIKSELERGRGQVAVCPSKPAYAQYNSDLDPIPFDPEKAKALLAEAGWTDTNGDGVLDKDGQRFELEIKYGSARPFYTQVTASMMDAAKKVGINMSTRQLEWATFVDDFYERRFDGVILYNSFPDSWVDVYDDFHSSQDVPRGGNASGWHNDEVDQLLEEMRLEFDPKVRDEKFHRFCEVFQQEQPYTLLMHGIVGVLLHDRIEDAGITKRGMQPHEFWVKPENRLHE